MCLRNYIWLAANDGHIPLLAICSNRYYTGTVNTIAASSLESPLALRSLLQSLLESLHDSLLERAALERAEHRDE